MQREEAGFLTTADSELQKQQRGHQDEQILAVVRRKPPQDILNGLNLDLSVWFLISNVFSDYFPNSSKDDTQCNSTCIGVQTAYKVGA